MELDDLFGNSEKLPTPKFEEVGDKVILLLTEDAKPMPVREFKGGKPGEQKFWQGNKVVLQSDLNMQLPFRPVVQLLIKGKTKDGTKMALWADGEKLKAIKAAARESGVRPVGGAMLALEFIEERDTGAPYPKKFFKAQLKRAAGTEG